MQQDHSQHQQQQDNPIGPEQQRRFRRLALNNEAIQSLPTILTVGRVCSIPILMALWFSPLQNVPEMCAGIFAAAAFTDWLDGYLARRLKADSAFGAFLDPVADKLMVAAVLILLSSQPLGAGPFAGNAWLLPLLSTAIIGREITMSALREWAASLGSEAYSSVAVSSWGKWKTATQMISLTLLLLSCRGGEGAVIYYSAAAGPPLLCVAAFLTVWSLKNYMQALWKYLK
ncbi:hypothetical protein WJX74_004783 [Apatococcus lobatus]|uniref:CDP-diacylglycerol--glycerol-3-phosphate 3-phosphatidyltransferase n=1 Tax=Apatococcus lobatus TaxID=904363 RepID=A0AAW1QL01_9CHLO